MNKPKILIVDDRVENLVALEEILSDLEVDIVRALSGNEAVAKTLELDFAIALIDVQMPDMDGFETLDLLREDRQTENLPVIFITATYLDEYHRIKGVERGAVDFMTKPIVPSVLLGKIRVFLNLYDQRIQLGNTVTELDKALEVSGNYRDHLEELVEERTEEIIKANKALKLEIGERKKAEKELKKHRKNLQATVKERTAELSEANKRLQTIVTSMAGRESRMAELKETIQILRAQLESAGLIPEADDPLRQKV